jgi:O-antigen/teichoic acid export membrane protein
MVLGWPASSVLMATLSRMRDAHAARQSLIIAGMMTITSALTFPAMVYLSFGTDFLVNTLLAKNWKDVIPLITVLAPVGAIQSVAVYNGAVLLANGHARLQFIVGAVNTLLLLATFAATVTQGIQFMVSAYAFVAVPLSAWMIWITCSKGRVSLLRFASSLLPAVLATAAGSAAVYLTTGFSLTSLQLWGTATVIYGSAVLLVYAFMFTRLRASLAMLSNPGDIAPTVAADS